LSKQKKARTFREGERKMVRVTIEFRLKAKKLKSVAKNIKMGDKVRETYLGVHQYLFSSAITLKTKASLAPIFSLLAFCSPKLTSSPRVVPPTYRGKGKGENRGEDKV
jgi:hypothetical protein